MHENLEPKTLGENVPRPSGLGVFWGPSQYGPKFLEGPARQLTNDGTLASIVKTAMLRGATMLKALLLAGLRLQRESQEVVPAEHGDLKRSAFTRPD